MTGQPHAGRLAIKGHVAGFLRCDRGEFFDPTSHFLHEMVDLALEITHATEPFRRARVRVRECARSSFHHLCAGVGVK